MAGSVRPSRWLWRSVEEVARHGMRERKRIGDVLQGFAAENEDPTASPHYAEPDEPDDVRYMLALLKAILDAGDLDMASLSMKCVKIISRRRANRREHGQALVPVVLPFLEVDEREVAAETASSLLNLCYEQVNVSALLERDGLAPLSRLLSAESTHTRAASAGAVQSVCYQPQGREAARECGTIENLVALLQCEGSFRVLARLVFRLIRPCEKEMRERLDCSLQGRRRLAQRDIGPQQH